MTRPIVLANCVWCPQCEEYVEFLKVARAARRASVSEKTIYRYIENCDVHSMKVAGKTYVGMVRAPGPQHPPDRSLGPYPVDSVSSAVSGRSLPHRDRRLQPEQPRLQRYTWSSSSESSATR